MELQGICHKMHAGLKDLSVTDQHTHKANVEYKFMYLVVAKPANPFRRVIALNVSKPKRLVTCVL